jgi:hypothetical protein
MARALRSGWLWWAIAALLALHCAIDLRLMPDSRDYIEMAGHLSAGAGLVTHILDTGTRALPDPRLHHPPGYGVLLAGLQSVGLPVLAALRTATVLCFAGTAILVWFLIGRLVKPAAAPAAMALFLALELLYEPWSYAMSEAPFQLLTAAALVWMTRHARPRPGSWFVAGLMAGLATLCRWIGLSLPMAAALWLWPRRRRLDAWGAMAALGAGYTLVLGPWLGRNAVLAGRLIGKASEPSHIPAWLNVVAFSRTLLLDLLPAVALVVVAVGVSRRMAPLSISRPMRLLLLWAGCYSAVLLGMASISFIDPISTRLTLPLYVALIPLCAAYALRRLAPDGWLPAASALAAALLILTGIFQVANARRRAALDPIAVSSPLTGWLETHTPPGSLIVNPSGAPVYFPATGDRYTFVRFFHLHDMDPAQPRVLLERFPGRFPALFLVLPATEASSGPWRAVWRLEMAGEVSGRDTPWRVYQLQPR